MSILRIKKGAEINLFLERSRKRVREKSGKKISLASRRRDREYRKRFSLASAQGKRVRESAEKDSLC
jgi:hypothetical protein